MKAATLLLKRSTPALLLSLLIAFGALVSAPGIFGQSAELSLADILIALRSKKVTLPERNKILTDAVMQRGITFSLTPEIEKELEATGADASLVDSIRKKSVMVKTSAVVNKPVETKLNPVPVSTPPPPDFNFYMTRAMANSQKGDLDAALVDFGKAIEMKPESADAYQGRGVANLQKKALDLAVTDLSKAIELNPKSAFAFASRGDAYQKKGDTAKAKDDYKKALDLDANVEPAKSAMAKITADELKAQKEADDRKAAEEAAAKAAVKPAPEFLDLGQLYATEAVKLVTPAYSPVAVRAGIQGKVKVEITIDVNGNVTSAKAVEGHQFLKMDAEEAARRSKFKPAMYDGKPIKAKGYIIYNFTTNK